MSYFENIDYTTIPGQVEILNRLHADEIRAAMQYVNHEVALRGPTVLQDQREMQEHYQDELQHAAKLRYLISLLGGLLENGFEEMLILGTGAPEGRGDVQEAEGRDEMLSLDLEGERDAIEAYKEACLIFQAVNPMVAQILTEILRDEYEHARDLQALLA